jgi:type VI secretion system secreted protein VgrG
MAIDFVLQNEGGFVDDQDDAGGATAYGITSAYLNAAKLMRYDVDGDGVITANDMHHFTRDNAREVYRSLWYSRGYDLIKDGDIAERVFDFAVNAGQIPAIKVLQKSLNTIIGQQRIDADGKLGIKTLNTLNKMSDEEKVKLLGQFKTDRKNFYENLISRNPKLSKFINGWVTRAYK